MPIGSSFFTASTTPAALSTGSPYAGGVVDLRVLVTSGTVYLGSSAVSTGSASYTTSDAEFLVSLWPNESLYGFRATTGATVRVFRKGDF